VKRFSKYLSSFLGKKKKKNCKVDHDLTEFVKIPKPESLNFFFQLLKTKIGVF
jgi:hypothetical protein